MILDQAARTPYLRAIIRRPSMRPPRRLAIDAAALVALALLTLVHSWWAAQIVLIPILLVVPGVILLRALRIPAHAVEAVPVYVPGASLVVLLGSGLAVDLIGPLVGVAEPLRTGPMLIGLEIICGALLCCSVHAPPETEISWAGLSRPARLLWPLVLPLIAAAGALRLNNGHDHGLALIALVLSVLLLISALTYAPRWDKGLLTVIVYSVGLAIMWSFSLRGNLVYGYDIASEYASMQQTVHAGTWHVLHRGDAYGAMLSVTVLPAELHALSGVPALLIFKAVYPAIGALFPVAVFGLACRILERRWAVAAAAFVVIQATFFQQLPGLARQEIALPMFAVLIDALMETRLPRRSQWTLVSLLSLGLVVSHYSTTYMAIPLLAIAAVLQWTLSWIRPVPRVTGAVVVAFVVTLAGAVVWYGLLTQSTSDLAQFVATAEGQGINLLPNNAGNLLATYLRGEANQQLSPAQYQLISHAFYRVNYPFIHPLPAASNPRYAVQAAPSATPPVRWALGLSTLNLGTLLIQQLTNLVAGLGALTLVLRRNAQLIARQVGLLGIASLVILFIVRISGTVAQAYNPERAFLQAMVVLAITLCWPMQSLATRWKRLQPAVLAAVALVIAVFLAGTAGLANVALGGATATNLANSGADYQQFYMTTQEIASATWLSNAEKPGDLVYADNYGQLRLAAVGGVHAGTFDDVTPLTINQNAWIYASRTNVANDTARSEFGNYTATYAFPFLYLSENYNTVYTNGASEVFNR